VKAKNQISDEKLLKLKTCLKIVIKGLERGEITGEQAALKIVEIKEEIQKITAAYKR
jgi:hypothetical protein